MSDNFTGSRWFYQDLAALHLSTEVLDEPSPHLNSEGAMM